MTKMWALTDATMMELITEYRKHPSLWNKDDKSYHNVGHKLVGYNKLLDIVKKEIPDADYDFIVKKMTAMKKSIVHCHKKMSHSVNKSYKPTLWYYDFMKFVTETNNTLAGNTKAVDCNAQNLSEDLFKEFIKLYKENECLWNKKNPLYFNVDLKSEAYDKLLELVTKEIPTADKSYVAKKLTNIRQYVKNHFRKSDPKKIGKTNLKFYNMFKFLIDVESECNKNNEEIENELLSQQANELDDEVLQIPNEVLNDFIATYKEFPCLWDKKSCSYQKVRQSNKAYDKLVILLKPNVQETCVNWSFVKNQITILRNNVMKEYKSAIQDKDYEITLPYFSKMSFIIDQDKAINVDDNQIDEDMTEVRDVSLNPVQQIDSQYITIDGTCYSKNVCDEFDAIAKCMSEKLRKINERDENQRYLCEALINDILLKGILEKLGENSAVVEKSNKPLNLNGFTSIYLTNTNTVENVMFDGKNLENQVITLAHKAWW